MPSRRACLKQNSLLAAGARAALAAPFILTPARSAPAAPIAETANGRLRGRTEDGIHVFRGVPNVVVVTVNHRLGALGYLHLGELAPEFAQSGVVGLMDLVSALQWVRDNIANFGGDPGKVLIFGQSGGGSKVCHLMAMPSANGLFHRAAAQSGAALRSGTRENAARGAERLIAQLGIPKSRLRDLQEATYEMIIGAQGASALSSDRSWMAWWFRAIPSSPMPRRSPPMSR